MLKLIKYEARKNRTLLAVVLSVIAALEAYFLISIAVKSEVNAFIATSLIPFACMFTGLTIFIMGISAYSRELKQKSSYLIFMTPSSPLSIVASKLLFTLVTGLVFTVLLAALTSLDFSMMMDTYSQGWRGYYNLLDVMMAESGMSLNSVLLTLLFFALLIFLDLVSTIGVAYLSITLSATFLQNKKGKGLVSVVLFCAISYGLSRLSGLTVGEHIYSLADYAQLMRALVPTLIQDLCVLILSLIGCAWMLEKRVSL